MNNDMKVNSHMERKRTTTRKSNRNLEERQKRDRDKSKNGERNRKLVTGRKQTNKTKM